MTSPAVRRGAPRTAAARPRGRPAWEPDDTANAIGAGRTELDPTGAGAAPRRGRARALPAARFQRAVYRLVREIPRGQVATYGQLAAILGWPRAARAVGRAMRECPPSLPWHRVVNASGGISLRANVGSMMTQRVLLEQESVPVRRGRIRLERHRWKGPRGSRRLGIAALARL